jgi:Cation/multidrug efflux pump
VAIVTLTLSPRHDAAVSVTAADLTRVARELRAEIAKVDDVGLTYLVGETGDAIRVAPDPDRLALYGVTLQQLPPRSPRPTGRFRPARCGTMGKRSRWWSARRFSPPPKSPTFW